MFVIYRCAELREHQGLNTPRATRRPPANIPYLVDNLWEWLRPDDMPNRRHAVFASPTPALATTAAGALGNPGFKVGIVSDLDPSRVAQIPQSDAREHPDLKALRNSVFGFLKGDWLDGPLQSKEALGRLFIPLLSAAEVQAVLADVPELSLKIRAVSTFWSDARRIPAEGPLPYEKGEVFFEAPLGYSLQPMEP